MRRCNWFVCVGVACLLAADATGQEQEGGKDKRLGPPVTLNSYFPFDPPKTLEEWEARRRFVKTQVRVATGLWPMPERTPLNAVIHGPIRRDGYTVEKVYFESYPGFYVTGSLYRPTDVKKGQKVPGVLCPHGHWGDRSNPATSGRFYDAGGKGAEAQRQSGAEKTEAGSHFPLQARCVHLARMGCVVFHYDMIGYGDSTQIYHPLSKQNPKGKFTDPDAELWLQSNMGLQTWNSVRSLDFLLSLPEVDPERLAVTGASGGGTQTFILAAVDDRVGVAFPAVMVSTAMQGGCICENCTYLRVGTGNIELAGLFAPKPLGMSAANDWTKELETKGLPQLKELYKLYGKEENVTGKAWLEFGHNYNQVAREFMYDWFRQHLNLKDAPVVERPFVPVPPAELSVFDAEHPRPKDAKTAAELRAYMREQAREQLKTWSPTTAPGLQKLREIVKPALSVMIHEPAPLTGRHALHGSKLEDSGAVVVVTESVEPQGSGERVPLKILLAKKFNGTVVVWVHPDGQASLGRDGKWVPEVQKILDAGGAVVAPDVFLTGSAGAGEPKVDKTYAGYTWGYNRTLLANRVHDILTTVGYVLTKPGVEKVQLVGFGEAGPWVVLASALAGDKVERTAADMNGFRFEEIVSMTDPMMLPGALKYGGMPAFAALCAPRPLYLHNAEGTDPQGWVPAAYRMAGQPDRLRLRVDRAEVGDVVGWLMQ